MSHREQLLQEIQTTPDSIVGEVLDFLQFLKKKAESSAIDPVYASHSLIAKEWFTEEEDKAWEYLQEGT